jgi:hypothetical protein
MFKIRYVLVLKAAHYSNHDDRLTIAIGLMCLDVYDVVAVASLNASITI